MIFINTDNGRVYNKLVTLLNETREIENAGWIPCVSCGSGAVGRTFENALGIDENTLEVPDYDCLVEIKTKIIRKDNLYKYINLFSAAPDGYLFETKRVVKTYGYPSRKNSELKVFNLSIYANKVVFTRKYMFKLKIDRIKKQLVLNIYDRFSFELIDNDVAWSFDLLSQKLYRKLKYLLYVKARKKMINGKMFFLYSDSRLYILKDFESFLDAIERDYIRVTFKIGAYTWGHKYGNVNDHGTSFDINEDYLEELFSPFKHE